MSALALCYNGRSPVICYSRQTSARFSANHAAAAAEQGRRGRPQRHAQLPGDWQPTAEDLLGAQHATHRSGQQPTLYHRRRSVSYCITLHPNLKYPLSFIFLLGNLTFYILRLNMCYEGLLLFRKKTNYPGLGFFSSSFWSAGFVFGGFLLFSPLTKFRHKHVGCDEACRSMMKTCRRRSRAKTCFREFSWIFFS